MVSRATGKRIPFQVLSKYQSLTDDLLSSTDAYIDYYHPLMYNNSTQFSMSLQSSIIRQVALAAIFLLSSITKTNAFVSNIPQTQTTQRISSSSSSLHMAEDSPFELMVELPGGKGLSAQMKLQPVLDVPSEIVEVRYAIPFGLNAEPKNGLAICTADGPGGEKVGDVLRFTSQWTMGLPRGNGAITTAASFSGAISWQVSMFDVCKASKWEEVIEALTSNVEQRTNEVVLLFERPLGKKEEV